jgi:hypothetical protein
MLCLKEGKKKVLRAFHAGRIKDTMKFFDSRERVAEESEFIEKEITIKIK